MLSNHHLKNCTAFRFVLMAFLCSKNICCGQLHSSPFCFYGALILEEFVAENCTAFRFVFIAFCYVNALTTAAENCTAFRFASMALYCCKNCRGNCTAFRSVLIYLYVYFFYAWKTICDSAWNHTCGRADTSHNGSGQLTSIAKLIT